MRFTKMRSSSRRRLIPTYYLLFFFLFTTGFAGASPAATDTPAQTPQVNRVNTLEAVGPLPAGKFLEKWWNLLGGTFTEVRGYFMKGQFDLAVEECNELLKSNPGNASLFGMRKPNAWRLFWVLGFNYPDNTGNTGQTVEERTGFSI